jgi:hypothetical protein
MQPRFCGTPIPDHSWDGHTGAGFDTQVKLRRRKGIDLGIYSLARLRELRSLTPGSSR